MWAQTLFSLTSDLTRGLGEYRHLPEKPPVAGARWQVAAVGGELVFYVL